MGRFIDETGNVYGQLTVLHLNKEKSRGKRTYWVCSCSCGNVKSISRDSLKSGHSNSCGCLRSKIVTENMTTHGKSSTREFFIWFDMKRRCYDKNNKSYNNYGGRGIKVDKRWLDSFENFYEDIGEIPEGFSLERVNVNGDYTSDNIAIANASRQSFNRRQLPNNTSGRTGVYWHKHSNRWRGAITVDGKTMHLGSFVNKEDCIYAREMAELKYFGFIKTEGDL